MGNKPSSQKQHNELLRKQLTDKRTNIEKIFETIKTGADPNMRINESPLIFELASTVYDRTEDEQKASLIIQYIYGKGVDLNQTATMMLNTPLITAIESKNIPIVKLLVSMGADINKANKIGNTPLIIATERSNIEIVKILVSNGADINKANNYNGNTPLIRAIVSYYLVLDATDYEIILILLNAKANIGIEAYRSYTPLIYASLKKDVSMVELLLKHATNLDDICVKLSVYTRNGSTALSIVTDKIKDLQNSNTNEEDNSYKTIQKLIVEKIINLSYNGVDPENFEKYGEHDKKIIHDSQVLSVTTLLREDNVNMNVDTTEDLVQMLLAEFNEKASEPKGGNKKAPFTKRKRKRKRKHLTKKRLLQRR